MRRLAALSKDHEFAVVVTNHLTTRKLVRDVGAELGFPVVSGWAPLEEWMAENGVAAYRGSALTVSAEDPHPSELQHGILGAHYAHLFADRSLVP